MIFETYGLVEPIYGKHKWYEDFYMLYSMNIKYSILANDLMHVNSFDLPNYGIEMKHKIQSENIEMEYPSKILGISRESLRNRLKVSIFDDDLLIRRKYFEGDIERFINHITDSQQLLMLYGLFENSIKNYLSEKKVESNIPQKELIKKLNEVAFRRNVLINSFNKYNSIHLNTSELYNMWSYYTNIRNLFAHSGGVITSEFISKTNYLRKKIHSFEKKYGTYFISKNLFNNEELIEGNIFTLTEFEIRVFRNLIVRICECIYFIDVNIDENNFKTFEEKEFIKIEKGTKTSNLYSSYSDHLILQNKSEGISLSFPNFYLSGYKCSNCNEEGNFLYKTLFNKPIIIGKGSNSSCEIYAEKVFTCPVCKSFFFPYSHQMLKEGSNNILGIKENEYYQLIEYYNSIGSNIAIY